MNAIVAAALAVLQLLSVAGAASAACATLAGPENMVVVLAPTPFYSWTQCNDLNGGPNFGWTTEPINETKHAGIVTMIDIQECNIECLEPDAFQVPGASSISTVYIQTNVFTALPEELFQNMTSLLFLFARNLDQLAMLPENIFTPVPQILLIFFSNSDILGTEQGLPDGLLRGLSKLTYFSFDYISYLSVPSMVDCTALQVFYGSGPSGATRGIWHLDDAENEAMLEGLVSLTTFNTRSQSLTRIPSLKDCGKLSALTLDGNLIT